MIKAKGTREEFSKLSEDIRIEMHHEDNIDKAIMTVFDRRGFITKPEWKLALKMYKESIKHVKWHDGRKLYYANNTIELMHAHIVELEKKLENGE